MPDLKLDQAARCGVAASASHSTELRHCVPVSPGAGQQPARPIFSARRHAVDGRLLRRSPSTTNQKGGF